MEAKIICTLALVGCVISVYAADQSSIRGVAPSAAQYYTSESGVFKCLDGKSEFPFSRVNDGYCDCLDGSDEPGTAACPNGKFYCRNVGYTPLTLNASFVDDGICDCCDGSDEQPGRCNNECQKMGAVALKQMREDLESIEAGLKTRARYARSGKRAKAEWQKRLASIDELIADSAALEEEWQHKKKSLEKLQNELQLKKSALEAIVNPPSPEGAPTPEEEDIQAKENWRRKHGGGGGGGGGEKKERKPRRKDQEVGAAAADSETKKEETEEERARRIAAQWIPGEKKEENNQVDATEDIDDSEFAVEDDSDTVEEVTEVDPSTIPELNNSVDQTNGDYVAAAVNEDDDAGHAPSGTDGTQQEEVAPSPPEPEAAKLNLSGRGYMWLIRTLNRMLFKSADQAELAAINAVMKRVQRKVDSARANANDASNSHSQLKSDKQDMETKLKNDYGPDDAFAALADQCYSTQVDKYTYKVCPFDKAYQDGSDLGSWSGFEDTYSTMKFSGGANCWNGPDRSMTVKLRCGRTEQMAKVSEPSRCTYASELVTPAACTKELLDNLRKELQDKQGILAAAAAGHQELRK